MDSKDTEISKIRARMKELGYNPRSLSMRATGKPDTLRNWFSGKSNNLRGDNYKAVMEILWPQKNTKDISQLESGLLVAIQALLEVLFVRERIFPEDMEIALSQHLRNFRRENQPDAGGVIEQLLEFVRAESQQRPRISSGQFSLRTSDQLKKD